MERDGKATGRQGGSNPFWLLCVVCGVFVFCAQRPKMENEVTTQTLEGKSFHQGTECFLDSNRMFFYVLG
jgi:hypothetical protein